MDRWTPRQQLQAEKRKRDFLTQLERIGMTEAEFLEKYPELTAILTDYNSPVGVYAQALLGRIELSEAQETGVINHGDYALHNYRPMNEWKQK